MVIALESTWVLIAKPIVIFAFVLGIVPIILWLERKLLGRFQSRLGPNRVGYKGLLQPAADVLKLLSKEASTPETAVPWMMAIAPVISIVTAVATLAFIPWGPVGAWGGDVGLYGIDVSIGVLYFFAFGSLGFYGLMLGGWHGPGPVALAPLWMFIKLMLGVIFFIWIRASLPRLRYDQLMSFGWKILLPLATLNVLATATALVVF